MFDLIKEFMRLPLLSSLILHCLVLLGLMWAPSRGPELPASQESLVEMKVVAAPPPITPPSPEPRRSPPRSYSKAKSLQKNILKPLSVDEAPAGSVVKGDPVSSPSPKTLSYAQELKVFLEQNKRYPRQAIRLGQAGTVLVKVKIGSDGRFNEIQLEKPSSFPILNKAAVGLFRRLGRFKPLPKGIQANSKFTIPIAYVIGSP